MYEPKIVKDGDPAFGIEGTFQIHNIIYVLNDDADFLLLNHLTDLGYRVQENEKGHRYGDIYVATMGHIRTKTEMLEEVFDAVGRGTNGHSTYFIDLNYKGQPKLLLSEQNIHDQIITIASQRRDLGYYNRPHDQMSDIAISRMSGFVKNMVDVDFNLWEEFVDEARHYHAQDFIRRMAHWSSQYSDQKPRVVKVGDFETDEIILGNKQFNLTKPLPISGLRGGPFFRR